MPMVYYCAQWLNASAYRGWGGRRDASVLYEIDAGFRVSQAVTKATDCFSNYADRVKHSTMAFYG